MITAFLEGALAGYGIAIPVGAIAILIVEVSLRRGFKTGAMAGAGAASADTIYAALAVLAGGTLASLLVPVSGLIRTLSGMLLLGIGGYGLWSINRPDPEADPGIDSGSGHRQPYLRFLGLTLLNPLTIVYFSALILGGGVQNLDSIPKQLVFVLGAGLSSLSWQILLALLGAVGHDRLSPKFQLAVSVIGYLVVIGFGGRILLRL